ncbi:hypothetical protein [Nocardia veterana]|uniref:Excreted virulence factor EspC (Type VII ESX diderm) n=1 Tax=Nocardia veterana TaxID=132249 RepID=A0A7X6RKN7_9NOCA|nr:hypothetical protein [Nocardia veterana]NKY89481.1 hypothetical protein [Nocardia veterana]
MSELDTWRQLSDEVAQGNLTLKVHRDALDAAVKLLQDYIDHIDSCRRDVQTVARVSGFGGFQMGQDLAAKFTRKGSGDGSIRERLKELADEAKAIQDVLRKAAVAYAQTDGQFADVLGGIQP